MLQNTRSVYENQLYFYTYVMNNLKMKLIKFNSQQYKKHKHLGVNLAKEFQELYNEIYKTLLKEFQKHLNKWYNISQLWIGIRNIVYMEYFPN